MDIREYKLKDGHALLIREAIPDDARAVLAYLEQVSGQSDFLSFGPGEFELTESEEQEFLRNCRDKDNQLYIVGLIDDSIVSTLNFSAGQRPRGRHSGELGMSVLKESWGLGIGSLMLDTLIDWARQTDIIKKINLRVRSDNQRAVQLYQRKGFVKEGTIRNDVFVAGEYFHHDWMGLEL